MKIARKRSLLIQIAAFSSYLLAAVVFTFPLVARFTKYFPSGPKDQDVFFFLWNNWWIHYAVTELHTKPYFTDYIIPPLAIDLRLGTLGLLYGLLCIPFLSLLGPVVVLNVQVLATAALNGYAIFRLTGHITKNSLAAFVSGLVFASIPAVNFHLALGRPSCAALWPAIFTIYFFLRLLESPDNRNSAWLSLFAIATLLADQQAAMFGACWLLVLAGHAIATRRSEVSNRAFLVRLGIAVAIAALPAYYLYYKPFVQTLGYTVPGAIEAYRLSFPVSLLWTPSLFWSVYGIVLPLGFLAALVLVRRVRPLSPWVIGSIIFIVLSFGPVVSGTRIPLLFSLVRRLPTMAQFRAPYRFQIPAAIGFAVSLGITLAWLAQRRRSRSGRALLVAGIVLVTSDLLAQRLVHGFAMQTMTHDPLYDRIAHDARDCLILEVPVGVRTGTDRIGPGETLSFHQPVHRKRLINGSTSRLPLATLEYYRSSPALMFLAGEPPPPGDLQADLQCKIRDLKVGYVVVHPDMLHSDHLQEVVALLERAPNLRRFDSGPGPIAFRVVP